MFKKWWIQREKLKAVHEDDLEQFLSSIGVLDQIKNGLHRCIVCNTQITLENLGAVYPKGNKINLVCERLLCLTEMNLAQGDVNE